MHRAGGCGIFEAVATLVVGTLVIVGMVYAVLTVRWIARDRRRQAANPAAQALDAVRAVEDVVGR